jgi:hypothetical protein
MQNILSINIYNSGIAALIIEGDANSKQIVETKCVSFKEKDFYYRVIKLLKESEEIEIEVDSDDIVEDSEGLNKSSESLLNIKQEFINSLTQLKTSIESSYSEIILVIPAVDNLSCKINLPFRDTKNIKQVIDMEVQDSLAFDVNDFVVPYKFIESKEIDENEFFINLIPKNVISFILDIFKSNEIEPYVVTTPASVLNSIYNLNDLSLDENSVCLLITEKSLEVSIIANRNCVFSRSIDFNYSASNITNEQLLSQLKLTLNSQEKERDITFSKIYLLYSSIDKSDVQHFLGRSVEDLNISSMIKAMDAKNNFDNNNILAYLAALSLNSVSGNTAMSNFRVREFSFNPYLSLLYKGLKKLLPFLYLVLILLFFYGAAIFLSREYKIIRLRKAVNQNSEESSGLKNLTKGKEISEIYGKNISLENQLESLGKRSTLSALDVLFNITKDIKKAKKNSPELEVKELKISGNNLTISGNASAYSDVEKFEVLLKKRKNMYCKIRRDTSNSSSKAREYKFIISLCAS